MTPQQVSLIQSSWAQVVPIREQAATLFYDTLFTMDPALRPLFKGDMSEQGRKLMGVLGVVVASLERLQELVPTVQALGAKHVGYGVRNAHYDTVGQALLQTLELGLGPAFTEPVRDAWATAYATLAGVMQEAAAASPQAA
ncbi:globin family protein [Uliginosibacterium sp. H1]|uniref:globin family protein n=1 Tax=Uliginosibacterium sp. H1 TaxID=3114757 RepID=UPI002E19F86E|nr:globin family protein [Uliginosibacterium sp. H1]